MQSFVPLFSYSLLTKPVYAQEVTPTEEVTPTQEPTIAPTPTEEVTPTEAPSATPTEEPTVSPSPTEEVTPTPTVEVTPEITPEPTVEVTPTEEVTPSVEPTQEDPAPSQSTEPPHETSPPSEQGQILDGVSVTATPEPTVTPEPTEQGTLAAVVIPNVKADTLDLDVVDPSSATLTTDKSDYAPTDTVVVTGTGFTAGKTYTIIISSTDEPAVSHENSVTANQEGNILYTYQLDGNPRPNYKVEVKIEGQVVAATTFTDSYTPPCTPYDDYGVRSNNGTDHHAIFNFHDSNKNVDISAESGYTITGVWLDLHNQGGGYIYFGATAGNYNPSGNTSIDSAKAHVERTCAPANGILTVIKHVVGTGSASSWTMHVKNSSNQEIGSFAGSEGGTNIDLAPGNYTVTETGPTGYTLGYTGCNNSGAVTVTSNQTIICTLTNTLNQPDLTVVKTNNVSGNLSLGDSFVWTLTVTNNGNASVSFSNDQDILQDNLPGDASYTPTSNIAVVKSGGTSGNIDCDINSDNLDCDASGTVTIPAGGSFSVSFTVTPENTGDLVNPRNGGGNKCQVDPDGLKSESNDSNNNCSNTVTVTQPLGSIKVCKVIVDAQGNIRNGSDMPSTSFRVNWTGGNGLAPTIVNSGYAANTKIFSASEGNDAFCVDYPNIPLANYGYSQEIINNPTGWKTPKYNDQFNTTVLDLGDFKNYQTPGDENSNGYMDLTNQAGPDRTLVILNQYENGKITVTKFNDLDGDGVRDENEPTMSGWQINLSGKPSQFTNGSGVVEFSNLANGTYALNENIPNGSAYRQTGISCSNDPVVTPSPTPIISPTPIPTECPTEWSAESCMQGPEVGPCYGQKWSYCSEEYSNCDFDERGVWQCQLYSFNPFALPKVEAMTANPGTPTPTHPVTVNAGDQITCTIGNQFVNPKLLIEKTNNAVGDLGPGGNVQFTIKVTAVDGTVNNVIVTDLPSKGFTYRSGSWSALKNGLAFALGEPIYASPGTWTIGTMNTGDVVELTYTADIAGDIQSGQYKDLAYAAGVDLLSNPVISNITEGVFVGTNVGVSRANEASTGVTVIKEGQVLGASTELPATGASTQWIFLAGILFAGGVGAVGTGIAMNRKPVKRLKRRLHV